MESLRYQALDARYATIKTAHTRTCRWLLKKSEYQDWLDVNKTPDHHGFLWIRGKPGSGKSTLTKFAVENARKATSETVISFFFNARGEDLEKSTRGMYQSLLFQILKAIPDLQIVLDRFRPVAQEESLKWEEDDLQSLFESAIKRLGQRRLTCFIDALDECEEGQIRDLVAFLERLGQLAISSQIHFYVFLSSRHYPYISIRNGIQMTLEGQEGHDQDIGKYLGSELKAGRGEQVEAIREEILKRSSGIFLWVALVVQILNKEYDHGRVHALRRRLREIPDGLDKLFEDILTRDQENMGEMVLCLQWILYAKRPLKRDEVYHAILSGTDPESLPALKSEEITAQDMERFIVSCSKGLAETTKLKAQTVQFIHESVRDYLLGKNGFNKLKSELRLDLSHDRLKQCCYDYMGIDTSAYLPPTIALPVASSEEARGLRELVSTKLPFLEYAVRNVLYHADVADGQGVSQKAFLKQFALSNWIMLDNLFEKYQIRRHTPNVSLTYIVAEKNFGNLVQIQIESDHDPGTVAKRLENERYGAPLYAALANANVNRETIQALFLIPVARNYDSGELHCGQSEQSDCEIERNRAAIKILVEKRPSLNPKKGETLIGWAASNGHEAVIKFLLARDDTNLNSVNFTNMYPLSLAAAGGHAGVVKLLLARDDIDLNLTDHRGRTPLSFAAEFGYEAIVKLLAKDDVDINSTKSCPLSLAAAGGHVGVVKLLLARNDINLNLTDQRGGTSLSYAAEFGHVGVFKLLLARNDINLNLTDQCGGTSLSYAAEFGHEAVVKLLLARDDVNINLTDRDSRPPLTLAAMYGHEAVVRLLLSRSDVDPNSKNNYGSTPLSVAVSRGYDSIVKLLLTKHDIDLNIQDNSGKTPLSLAAWNGHASLVDLLLSRDDVDPNLKDNYGQTPLSLTATNGYESIIRLLLARDDIDSNPTDKKGQTPLSLAAEYKRESIVGLLLAHINNDPNQKGKHG